MKICFVELQPTPYLVGGGTTHIVYLSKYLIKKGHEVSIVSSKPDKGLKLQQIGPRVRIYNVGLPHKTIKTSNAFSMAYQIAYRLLWESIWVAIATIKIRMIKPDVCNPQSLITTSLPCYFSGIPFVATQHGAYFHGFDKLWSERGSKAVLFTSRIYKWIESFNAKKARYITCVSADTYDYYKKFGEKKCTLITHGVDFDDFKNVDLSKKRDYLFVGRLTEQKGVSYLLDSMDILDKQGIRLTLNLAGDGEEEYVQKLKEKTSKFKHIKVNFLGFVTGKAKFRLYAKSKVFISSSVFEPFGIVNTEAMASGCAMISADHMGGKLLVKPSFGRLVKYEDESKRAQNLADAIRESLKWNVKKMGAEAIKEAKKYSYDKLVDRYIELFEDVAR